MDQREIKFRVFNGHEMEYNVLAGSLGAFYVKGMDEKDSSSLSPFNTKYHENIKVMQFTGLKDKGKKKEIFEGDIMTIQLPLGGFWGNTKTEKTGVVLYEADHGGFIVEWEYSKNQHHENLTCDIACEGVVIGNIYQNPELITNP